MSDVHGENPPEATTVAAIDVGSNSLRMVIAEVLPDGRIEILERVQRAVRLGQDTFRRGRLGRASMRAAVAVLRDFRQMLRLYHVDRVRAVATSAVREAGNADTFLDRVFLATGLNVEMIATSEESRLTVSAVREAISSIPGVSRKDGLVADVGGGSTLLTVLHAGGVSTTQSLRLGSIRLQEVLLTSEETPQRSAALLKNYISNSLDTVGGSLPLEKIDTLIAVGGDARFAAREIGQPTESEELVAVDVDEFEKLVRRCQRRSVEALSKQHGLSFAEAETLTPALLVYQALLKRAKASKMLVCHVSMRDGLLLELAREVTGQEDTSLLEGVIHSATGIAKKYGADMSHAENVAELSVRLFDQLQTEHGLGPRYRLLLQVAGLLHEVGSFVSARAHHKHSYYLISNSEIFGLNRDEIEIVAHIARYHRRSLPKSSHIQYVSRPREARVVINKLAAMLRVADALSRGRLKKASDLHIKREADELIIYFPGISDFLSEQRSIANKGNLFEEIYGMKVRLEEG